MRHGHPRRKRFARRGKECFDAYLAGDHQQVMAVAQEKAETIRKKEGEKLALLPKAVPKAPAAQSVAVVVPAGCSPGSTFTAQLPNGVQFAAVVPPGMGPGSTILVAPPPAPPASVPIPVVQGVPAGQPKS